MSRRDRRSGSKAEERSGSVDSNRAYKSNYLMSAMTSPARMTTDERKFMKNTHSNKKLCSHSN